MTPPTQPLALTATYLALLQPRQSAPAAAATPAPEPPTPAAAAPRGRYVDMLV
jgi:hypothetical protein